MWQVDVPQIADALEEDVNRVQRIVDVAEAFAPYYDEEKVMEVWSELNYQ